MLKSNNFHDKSVKCTSAVYEFAFKNSHDQICLFCNESLYVYSTCVTHVLDSEGREEGHKLFNFPPLPFWHICH